MFNFILILSSSIPIEIINDTNYEKHEEFYVELGEPIWANYERKGDASLENAAPILSENNRCKIIIIEDDVLKVLIYLLKIWRLFKF